VSPEVVRVYASWAVIHGLVFFIEGRLSWGRLYLVGALCFAAGALQPLAGMGAPLVYGLLMSTVFDWLSFQARRLAAPVDGHRRRRATGGPPTGSGAAVGFPDVGRPSILQPERTVP
jgi:hypothetical protein